MFSVVRSNLHRTKTSQLCMRIILNWAMSVTVSGLLQCCLKHHEYRCQKSMTISFSSAMNRNTSLPSAWFPCAEQPCWDGLLAKGHASLWFIRLWCTDTKYTDIIPCFYWKWKKMCFNCKDRVILIWVLPSATRTIRDPTALLPIPR